MALVLMDGCDNYNTEALMRDRGWDGTATYMGAGTTGGRFGGGYVGSKNDDANPIRPLISPQFTGLTSLIIGFSHYWSSSDSIVTDGLYLVAALEGATHHAAIRVRTAGPRTLQVYTAGGYQGSASSYQIPLDQWVNFQVKFVLHDTTGSVEVKADGVQVLNVTGIDTINGGAGECTHALFGGADANSYFRFIDDVGVWSLTGDAPTDFLSDFVIETLRPNADSTPVNFTKSAGANNYENVDDVTSDEDSGYNYDSTIGNKDRLDLPSLSKTPETIYGVQSFAHAKKDSAGGRSLQVGVYSGATEGLSSGQALASDYAFYTHLMTVNPDDSLAWENADIDALEVQYETA